VYAINSSLIRGEVAVNYDPHPFSAAYTVIVVFTRGMDMDRSLPDQYLNLYDTADFILNSRLAREAMEETSIKNFPVFLRDLLEIINSLATSCHMPEFTDHSLLHLCSLVDRISQWTCAPNNGETPYLIEQLEPEECAILLVAILIHDIGMLSQKAKDLEDDSEEWIRERTMGFATWVRKTHVSRMRKLIQRLFEDKEHKDICEDPLIKRAIDVAKAHEKWPWEDGFIVLPNRDAGLAAVLAVSDLFDEDSNRCDTMTLIRHRNGTMLNIGHWIKHMLTSNKVLVEGGIVSVTLVRPPGTDVQLLPVYAALRNHFKLALLYKPRQS
jgi:hypothetical protein